MRLAEQKGVPVRRVEVAELDRLAAGERHQGVLATLGDAPRRWTLEQVVALESRPLIVVLDGVEDPHNVGAILRTADAVGATALVRQERHAAALGPAAARASAGALAHVRIVDVVNVARAIETLKSLGIWVVGIDAEGAQPYDRIDFRPSTALVVGAEGEGLRRLVREHCDFIARCRCVVTSAASTSRWRPGGAVRGAPTARTGTQARHVRAQAGLR